MSFMDDCEERAFEHGRSVAIEGFTTQELITELCKREGVTDCVVAGDSRYCITNEGNIHYQVYAPATILIVKIL